MEIWKSTKVIFTYCTRKVQRGSFNTHNSVKIRSMKNYSSENFLMELNKINWFQVTDIVRLGPYFIIFLLRFSTEWPLSSRYG